MDTAASRPSGQGSGNEAHQGWLQSDASAGPRVPSEEEGPWRLRCPVPGTTVFTEDAGPVSCWSRTVVSEEGGYLASCSCRKPLGASAMSAVKWGITLQDSGVEMSSVLPAEQTSASSVSSKLAWFLLAFYKQIPFSPLIKTQLFGIVCFKIKFCFGVNYQLLCFRGCLPAWKSLPLPQPRDDSQPHSAPFFWVFLFFSKM